ncbi:MAG: glycosyltransferase [Candidatus Omnitrophica bacterium]|nr:glycosyltransferase [Candidatus Omnitrophota bacterium]MDD5670078.1 glycosyltransferase [Candidatus Omnitrophota bacterium]
MTFNPKVSIVIPVYNGESYLEEAIDSALAQTYRNFEIIVVNDGSDDGGKTEAVALSYGDKIRYFPKKNGGVSTALNWAIKEMKGEYFSWLSHDDVYLPNKLETQISYLRGHVDQADRIILYSDWYMMDPQSKITGEKRVQAFAREALPYAMMLGWVLNGCALLIPKRCFDQMGLFDENLRLVQDSKKWFEFSQAYDFCHIPEPLVKCRIHPSQAGARLKERFAIEKNEVYAWAFDHFLRDACQEYKNKINFSYPQLITHYQDRRLGKAALHVCHAIPAGLWQDKLWGYWYLSIGHRIHLKR